MLKVANMVTLYRSLPREATRRLSRTAREGITTATVEQSNTRNGMSDLNIFNQSF